MSRADQFAAFDVVLIAASVGGIEAVREVISGLSPRFPAAIVIVTHMTNPASYFVNILSRVTSLPVKWAEEYDPIRPGHILVAQPGKHLIIRKNRTCHVSSLQKLNYVRPSADILFESAAYAYGKQTLGVVLTGSGRDGAVGSRFIKNADGRVLVQDRQTSYSFDMPHAAIETGAVDFILPLGQMASTITAMVTVKGVSDLFRVSPNFASSYIGIARGLCLSSS
ncbi:chemotaxis protein CheB [Nitrospira sp. KM1]|uniref:chemotaxis protein CheB n=1 Tax=Nitrospira sp. KM1 TaxID=1936990 RepID=UPI0013A7161B|nr:chemotaxis protein CheB [Nitrospira sp. KM1]BCA55979.1 chemotaxis protein CheB [Nitrospira sp. KM1]